MASLFGPRLIALLIALALPGAALAQNQTQEITLEQGRVIAHQALASGDPGTTRAIASALLQANPNDPDAAALLAASELQLGNPRVAVRSARLSFRNAGNNRQLRYQTARLAAAAATANGNQGVAKYWLRRASDFAETPEDQAVLGREFQILDGRDRWERGFSFSIVPSSNINNGADSDLLKIDGAPGTGHLSGDAQALSGYRASVSARLAYRLKPRERSATKLQFQYYGTFHALTKEAQALSPTSKGSDFNFSVYIGEVIHTFLPVGMKGPFEFRIGASQQYYGGEELLHAVSTSLSKVSVLQPGLILQTRFAFDHEITDSTRAQNAERYRLETYLSRKIGDLGNVTIGLKTLRFDSESLSNSHYGVGTLVRYTPNRQLGPMIATLGVGYDYRHYPDHVAGITRVPGGRSDHALSAQVDMLFPDWKIMGFAPVVTVRAAKTSSNVSRYDATDLSVGLSVQSSF